MTETKAGHLNEPNLIDECVEAVAQVNMNHGYAEIGYRKDIMIVIEVLRRRGLLNEAGLEIIERDTAQ